MLEDELPFKVVENLGNHDGEVLALARFEARLQLTPTSRLRSICSPIDFAAT
jgi:hypothetical protein